MAKRLLLNVLVSVLGDYIEGLTEDNLKLGVWSGEIVLNDLHINRKILQKLGLPVSIVHGVVASLTVIIPWASLETNPVRILADGIYLQVNQLNMADLSGEFMMKRAIERKRYKLEEADRLAGGSLGTEVSEKDMGYFQRLTATIVDNLEVKLTNLHFRYEDNHLLPDVCFSAGVTLDSFSIKSTDENWNDAFVSRSANSNASEGASRSVYKTATLENLGVYWNTNSSDMSELGLHAWQERMQEMIYKDGAAPSDFEYVLATPNMLTVKVVRTDRATARLPRVDVIVEDTTLVMNIDRIQFLQFVSTMERLLELQELIKLFTLRPRRRPMQDPRGWWQYAAKLVLRRETLCEDWERVLAVARVRNRYLALLRALRGREEYSAPMTVREEDELFDIESKVPLCALLVWRGVALAEWNDARAREALENDGSAYNNSSAPASRGLSFFGWGARAASPTGELSIPEEAGDVSFESLREDLGRNAYTELASDAVAFRLRFRAQLTLHIFVVERPIATVGLGLNLTTTLRSEARSAAFSVDQLYVTDRFTEGAAIKNLIAVQRDAQGARSTSTPSVPTSLSPSISDGETSSGRGETCFSVLFSNEENKSNLKISALPLEIALNEPCIKQLMFFFANPQRLTTEGDQQHNASSGSSSSSSSVSTKKDSSFRSKGGEMTVTFEVAAPKIIVPEECRPDCGFLLLDCGFLVVQGTTGQGRSAWDVSLKQVNAGMPRSTSDMYAFAEQQLYLIKPFDIGVKMSKDEKVSETANIDVQILPELRGELDASKLYRLLRCIKVAIRCFSGQPDVIIKPAVTARRRAASEDRGQVEATMDQLTTPLPSVTPGRVRRATQPSVEDRTAHLTDEELTMLKMCINIRTPVLALDLYYNSNSTNYVDFSMVDLTVKMGFRPFDMRLGLCFSCMSIADTARPAQQPVLRTLEECKDEQQITYTSVSDRRSPYFKHHGSQVEVIFAHLLMNADVEAFGHVQPFVQAVLGYGPEVVKQALEELQAPKQPPSPPPPGPAALPVTPQPYRGRSRLRSPTAPATPTPPPQSTQPTKPTGLRVYCDFKRTTVNFMKLEQRSGAERLSVVDMFSLRVLRLIADIDMRELMKILVSFATFAVVDIRDYHSDYVFKTIVAANVSQHRNPPDNDQMGAAPEIVSIDVAEEPTEKILIISYDQLTAGTSTVEIDVKSVVMYVSLDTILELVSVSVQNAHAFLALFQRPKVLQEAIARVEMAAATALMALECPDSPALGDPSWVLQTNTINTRASVASPTVVLLQDPTSKDTRALVGSVAAFEITYQRDVGLGERCRQVNESLLVSVSSLETNVVLRMGRWLPQQVLEPLCVDFQLSRRHENDRRLALTLKLDVDEIVGRLSLNDIALLQAILLQRALVRPTSAPAPEPTLPDSGSARGNLSSSTVSNVPSTPGPGPAVAVQSQLQSQSQAESGAGLGSTDERPCMYQYTLSSGPIKAIFINDFNRQNLPVLQTLVDKVNFNGRGTREDFQGEGSLIVNVDFYNPQALCWEPIVDRWKPLVRVASDGPELAYFIWSEYTLQCSITGAMLESLLQTYSLLTRHEDSSGRERAPPMLVRNTLGVPISLRDSVTGQEVVRLGGHDSAPMRPVKVAFVRESSKSKERTVFGTPEPPKNNHRGTTRVGRTAKFSGAVNLYVLGGVAVKREPLCHLPTKVEGACLFTLSPALVGDGKEKMSKKEEGEEKMNKDDTDGNVRGDCDGVAEETGLPVISAADDDEPVLEEVFQHHRYDPIKGTWVVPFLVGDPQEFTNSRGKPYRLDQVVLPSDIWRWQGSWEPEVTADVGSAMDEAGWYYGASFQALHAEKNHRVHRNMDCVRRRRWTRLRIPRSPPLGDPRQALPVVWDVQTLSSGSRVMSIMSPVLLKNTLPFPVMVALCNDSWPQVPDPNPNPTSNPNPNADPHPGPYRHLNLNQRFEYGPIDEDTDFSFPLEQSNATEILVCPAIGGKGEGGDWDYDWSAPVPCVIRTNNYTKGAETTCGRRGDVGDSADVYIRLLWKSRNKRLTISLLPHLVLSNNLLCSLRYKFASGGGSSRSGSESGVIKPGTKFKLSRVNWRQSLSMSFSAGSNGWSAPKFIDVEKNSRVNIDLPVANGHTGLVLTASLRNTPTWLELNVFSHLAVLDRTGLNTSVLSRRKPGVDILRRLEFSTTTGQDRGTEGEEMHPVEVKDVISARGVVWNESTAAVGGAVHTDVPSRVWSHLPYHLVGQTYLNTKRGEGEGAYFASKSVLQFTVSTPCVIILAFEPPSGMSGRSHRKGIVGAGPGGPRSRGEGDGVDEGFPKWVLEQQGFCRMDDDVVASMRTQGRTQDMVFCVFGRFYGAGDRVMLGDKLTADTGMYSVFVVHPSPAALTQVIIDDSVALAEADKHWADGGEGIGLIFADDAKFAVGVHAGEDWSDELPLDDTAIIPRAKNGFNVKSTSCKAEYLLAYKVAAMPGHFSRTKLITLMPRYCIINCVNEAVFVCQDGRGKAFLKVPPFTTQGWHKDDYSQGTKVHVRLKSTQWCLAGLDINEIGSLSVLLPALDDAAGQVLHIEVKIAEPEQDCQVAVLIWRASNDATAGIGIENETDENIVVRQSGINLEGTGHNPDAFIVSLPPRSWKPFGWADPDEANIVEVAVGESFHGATARTAKLDVTQVDTLLRLPVTQHSYREVQLAVEASSYGRLIRISCPQPSGTRNPAGDASSQSVDMTTQGTRTHSSKVSVHFVSLGVSLVLERPVRREFLSAYMDDVGVILHSVGETRSLEVAVGGLQIDNYSEAAIFSACIYSRQHDERRTGRRLRTTSDVGAGDGRSGLLPKNPFLHMVGVQERPSHRSAKIFKYIAVRMLEIVVEIDSASVRLLQVDLLNDLKIVSRDEALAASVPAEWVADLNRQLMQPPRRAELRVMSRLMLSALSDKMYIESLIVHPIKLTITVIQTPFPRKDASEESVSTSAFNALTSLAGVERMQLKLFSFIVSSAMESPQSLWQRIQAKSWQDLQFQLAKVAGSLRVIGAPMGLARNIGSGLQAFLYEPIQGAMESPTELILGIGKGTTSLVGGVVAGALNSTAAIVNSASNGLSFLTGDDDFVRSRAVQRQRSNAVRGGALSGFVEGGESIVTGLSSGLAGLFLKPWEAAQNDGAAGFLKGLGLGLVGVAVKPVLGITDGFTAMAQGVSTEVGGTHTRSRVRPPRAMDRSGTDPAALVLCPLDLQAALAQEFVVTRAKEHCFHDGYVKYVALGDDRYVILSEKYLYWKRSSEAGSGIWGRVWEEISHVAYGDGNGRSVRFGAKLVLYDRGCRPQSRSSATESSLFIDTTTRRQALALYQALADNAHRMGNPVKVLPVDMATDAGAIRNASDLRYRPWGPANEWEAYLFGSFNGRELDEPVPDLTESALLQRTQESLGSHRELQTLDLELWRLMFRWNVIHTGLNASRACALLVLNRSNSALGLSYLQLTGGRDARVLGTNEGGYDFKNRRVLPGGSFTVFACAYPTSPLEPGHLRFELSTTAFSAIVGSQLNEASCVSRQGFRSGFLEKSMSEWWQRYVLVVV